MILRDKVLLIGLLGALCIHSVWGQTAARNTVTDSVAFVSSGGYRDIYKITFTIGKPVQYVDCSYRVENGQQFNNRMVPDSTNNMYTFVGVPLGPNERCFYKFTYFVDGAATETEWKSYARTLYTQSVEGGSASGTVKFIFTPAVGMTIGWVDLHYQLFGGDQPNPQVNVRLTSVNNRFEHGPVQVQSNNRIQYYFTFHTGDKAFDTETFSQTYNPSSPPTSPATQQPPTAPPTGQMPQSVREAEFTQSVALVAPNMYKVSFTPRPSLTMSFVELQYRINEQRMAQQRLTYDRNRQVWESRPIQVMSGERVTFFFVYQQSGSNSPSTAQPYVFTAVDGRGASQQNPSSSPLPLGGSVSQPACHANDMQCQVAITCTECAGVTGGENWAKCALCNDFFTCNTPQCFTRSFCRICAVLKNKNQSLAACDTQCRRADRAEGGNTPGGPAGPLSGGPGAGAGSGPLPGAGAGAGAGAGGSGPFPGPGGAGGQPTGSGGPLAGGQPTGAGPFPARDGSGTGPLDGMGGGNRTRPEIFGGAANSQGLSALRNVTGLGGDNCAPNDVACHVGKMCSVCATNKRAAVCSECFKIASCPERSLACQWQSLCTICSILPASEQSAICAVIPCLGPSTPSSATANPLTSILTGGNTNTASAATNPLVNGISNLIPINLPSGGSGATPVGPVRTLLSTEEDDTIVQVAMEDPDTINL